MTNWYRDLANRIQTIALAEGIAEVDMGYMDNAHDIAGLESYLKQMDAIPKDAVIMPMREFEQAVEDGSAHGGPVYGYYINLDERGEFYADVRDAAGNTVYEVRSESDDEGDHDEEEDFEEGLSEEEEQYYLVTLIAKDIQVTARNETEAYSFAKEDAREFSAQWNYEVEDVTPANVDGEEADDFFDIEVARTDKGKHPWTFAGKFALYARGISPQNAAENAIKSLKQEH